MAEGIKESLKGLVLSRVILRRVPGGRNCHLSCVIACCKDPAAISVPVIFSLQTLTTSLTPCLCLTLRDWCPADKRGSEHRHEIKRSIQRCHQAPVNRELPETKEMLPAFLVQRDSQMFGLSSRMVLAFNHCVHPQSRLYKRVTNKGVMSLAFSFFHSYHCFFSRI